MYSNSNNGSNTNSWFSILSKLVSSGTTEEQELSERDDQRLIQSNNNDQKNYSTLPRQKAPSYSEIESGETPEPGWLERLTQFINGEDASQQKGYDKIQEKPNNDHLEPLYGDDQQSALTHDEREAITKFCGKVMDQYRHISQRNTEREQLKQELLKALNSHLSTILQPGNDRKYRPEWENAFLQQLMSDIQEEKRHIDADPYLLTAMDLHVGSWQRDVKQNIKSCSLMIYSCQLDARPADAFILSMGFSHLLEQ